MTTTKNTANTINNNYEKDEEEDIVFEGVKNELQLPHLRQHILEKYLLPFESNHIFTAQRA